MTYSAVQLRNAKMIVAEVKSFPNLGDADHRQRAADIALAVCLVESNLHVTANSNIPESMRLPHDAVGHDHLSVGCFQQQTPMWGSVRDCMDVTQSTAKFLSALTRFDWVALTNGQAAQRVQGSAFPDRYQERDQEAIALRKQLWGAAPVKPAPKPPVKSAPATMTYKVAGGDNLRRIASRFGTTVSNLVSLNRAKYPTLSSNIDHIEIGWVLRVR